MSHAVAKRKSIVVVLAGAVAVFALIVGIQVVRFGPQSQIKIRLKRYGRAYGQPLAWLILTNTGERTVSLLGVSDQVPTAFCDYQQNLWEGKTQWVSAPNFSSVISLPPHEQTSVRILLPTNGIPVKIKLSTEILDGSPSLKIPAQRRLWLYRHHLLSPIVKLPVPFDLLMTNAISQPNTQ
jgi:hypothetical protein